MYSNNTFNTFLKKITSIFLIVFFSASFLIPQKTFAGASDSDDAANWRSSISNMFTAVSSSVSAAADGVTSYSVSSLAVKEYILDTIVPFIREAMIKSITASIINWINNGFEGDPMFITDLEGFLLDIANETTGKFISDVGLTGLCTPFKPQILIGLSLSHSSSYLQRAECTLLDVIDNIEAFQEDFRYGGWQAFIKILEPQNNYYGSSYMAQKELQTRLELAMQINQTKINWGDGFLSWEECTVVGDDFEGPVRPSRDTSENDADFVGPTQWKDCQINTPGSVIYEQLNQLLPSGLRNLELADEINEIVGALLVQVMKSALGGAIGGLRGTSYSGGAISRFNEGFDTGDNESANNTIYQIEKDIQTEIEYKNIKEDSLFAINDAEPILQSAKACYQQKADSGRTFSRISEDQFDDYGMYMVETLSPAEAQQKADDIQRIINTQIRPYNDTETGSLVVDISTASENITKLTEHRQAVLDSKDVYEMGDAISNYANIGSDANLHTETDVLQAKFERDGYPGASTGQYNTGEYDGFIKKMNKLKTNYENELVECNSYE